jgi:Carbohydrate-binding module 48 (Isoamylase N-terminal domain)
MPVNQSTSRQPGTAFPLGATVTDAGTNFAVASTVADAMALCLFDETVAQTQIPMRNYDVEIWHVFVPGVGARQAYGVPGRRDLLQDFPVVNTTGKVYIKAHGRYGQHRPAGDEDRHDRHACHAPVPDLPRRAGAGARTAHAGESRRPVRDAFAHHPIDVQWV